MTEPNWTDIDVVRNWLGSRYPIANGRTGSPFFQYLKDEQAKGRKIRGREKHLSGGPGGEFRRWVWDNSQDSVIHYSADAMRTTYYPEYVDHLSQSRSQTPTYDEDTTGHRASDFHSGLKTDHAKCERSKKRAKHKPRTTKPVSKSKNVNSLGAAPSDPTTTKQSKRKTLPGASRARALKQIDTKLSRLQEERITTLRPGRNRKHRKTGRTICTTLERHASNVHPI